MLYNRHSEHGILSGGTAMICALIGDRTIGNLKERHLEDRLRVLIEERHVSAFVLLNIWQEIKRKELFLDK